MLSQFTHYPREHTRLHLPARWRPSLLSQPRTALAGLYKPIALLCMPVTPSPPQPAHLPQQQADVGEEQGGTAPGPHRAAALLHKILLRGSQAVAVAPPKPGERGGKGKVGL